MCRNEFVPLYQPLYSSGKKRIAVLFSLVVCLVHVGVGVFLR